MDCDKIGKYLIREELGSGAMASVYKVIDEDDGSVYALKLLHSFLNESSTIVRRFRRESELIASMRHRHIVAFHDYIEDDGVFACVMEFIEADTLEDILAATGRLDERFAVSLVMQLCEALSYAHSLGIIHRDVKPSNIFIVKGRGLVLTDFGFAKPLFGEALTVDGAKMMGTPYYMAPEQVKGEATDERTDVYQAGLLLYQLVTGRIPFADRPVFEAVTARCKEPLSFSWDDDEAVGNALRERIWKATGIEPDKRYQSAAEMYEAVAELHHSRRSG